MASGTRSVGAKGIGKRPLLWFVSKVGPHEVRVFFSRKSISRELHDCIGHTQTVDGHLEILIDASLSRDVQDTTLLHELMHCSVWHGSDAIEPEEETFVETSSSALMQTLKEQGFTWPRRPPGIAALERGSVK